nr:hypothetical protein [Candidatus Eremiobacteraeota bacterium]
VVGYYTPVNAPLGAPTVNPNPVTFFYPSAPTQTLAVTMPTHKYNDWYAMKGGSGASGATFGACGSFVGANPESGTPYTGSIGGGPKVAPPSGMPYAYPNPNDDNATGVPATFTFKADQPGYCTTDVVTVYDSYTHGAYVPIDVMGPLTSDTSEMDFGSPTSPAESATFSKTFDNQTLMPSVSDGGSCAGIATWSTSAGTTQPGINSGQTTAMLMVTPVKTAAPPETCTISVGDQYAGEIAATILVKIEPNTSGGGGGCVVGTACYAQDGPYYHMITIHVRCPGLLGPSSCIIQTESMMMSQYASTDGGNTWSVSYRCSGSSQGDPGEDGTSGNSPTTPDCNATFGSGNSPTYTTTNRGRSWSPTAPPGTSGLP